MLLLFTVFLKLKSCRCIMPVSYTHLGDPIDGGPDIEGQEVEIGGPSVNPVRRKQPSELIATGIAGIDSVSYTHLLLPTW